MPSDSDIPPKSGKYVEYEFPKGWTAKDRVDFINGKLANSSAVASVELYMDFEDDELVARVWAAKA